MICFLKKGLQCFALFKAKQLIASPLSMIVFNFLIDIFNRELQGDMNLKLKPCRFAGSFIILSYQTI